MLLPGSYSLSRFSTCDEGVYFMYMTAGTSGINKYWETEYNIFIAAMR